MDSGQPDPGTNPAGNPLLEMAGHGAAAIPTSAPIASSPVYISSPMVKPAPFSGREEDCSGFLLQCSLALEVQPYQFPTERSKSLSSFHSYLAEHFNGQKPCGIEQDRLRILFKIS